MAKLLKAWTDDWSHLKKARWYKLIWCAMRHQKQYKIYSAWHAGGTWRDIKVYGCMKCNIWRLED
jgi:hypothetical protein